MRKIPVWFMALLLPAGCGTPISAADRLPVLQDKRLEPVPDEVIVKFKAPDGIRAEANVFPEDIVPLKKPALMAGSLKLESMSFESRDDTVLVKVPPGEAEKAAMAYLTRPDVEWAMPNARIQVPTPGVPNLPAPGAPGAGAGTAELPRIHIAVNDPLAGKQWYLDRIGAPAAWATSTGVGVIVAVLDTGVDDAHPDLAGAVELGTDFTTKKGDSRDKHGHGTHVAGIIAARKDNGQGIVGVAPGANILAVRVLDERGSSGIFSVARGIKFAADYAKRTKKKVVINLSLGASMPIDPIDFVAGWYASRQGALLVAAAGNDGGAVGVPAKHRYFMAVAATDQGDAKAGFSNFGPQLAISAPGVNILSTTPTYPVTMTGRGIAQNYAPLQGTSMATPVVAGVAALVWSKHPDWTATQVREALVRSARSLGEKNRFGAGLVDAKGAVAL